MENKDNNTTYKENDKYKLDDEILQFVPGGSDSKIQTNGPSHGNGGDNKVPWIKHDSM